MRAINFVSFSALLANAYATPSFNDASNVMTEGALTPIDNPLMRSTVQGEKILPRMSMTR